MKTQCTGFSMTVRDTRKKYSLVTYLTGILMFFGLFDCLWSVLGLSGQKTKPAIPLIIGLAYVAASCGSVRKWRFASVAAACVPVVLSIVAMRFVSNGLNLALNQSFLTFESYLGRIMPRYDVDDKLDQTLCVTLFLILLSVLLGSLCGRTVSGGKGWRIPYCLLAAMLWASALFLKAPLPLLGVMVFSVSTAVLTGMFKGYISPWLFVFAVVLTLISAVPPMFMRAGDADSARLSAVRAIHAIRYDGSDHSLPEGNFSKLSDAMSWTGSKGSLSGGNAYYLRGFVGEIYIGDGWTELPPDRRAKYATLFSWLHNRGFYGQYQHALLTDVLGINSTTVRMPIENTEASARYMYTAYETFFDDADENRIGDTNILSKGLRGQRHYSISVPDTHVSDYESLYGNLAAAYQRGDAKVAYYLTSENAYREHVYDTYLDIPEEAYTTIGKLLQGLDLPQGKISFSDAQLVVNTYLSNLAYVSGSKATYKSGDFLTYFLEEAREGNSVHFATAATLIFRYLGVPARYVEGYVFMKSDSGADGISLNTTNSHAWAEIYRDGVGFVPFETNLPTVPPQIQDTGNQHNEDIPPEKEPMGQVQVLLWFFLATLLLPLFGFLCLFIRRAVKKHKLKQLWSVRDNAEAVSHMTNWLIRLLAHADIVYKNGSLCDLLPEVSEKFGRKLSDGYYDVVNVQRAAIFSGRGIDDGGRLKVSGFLDEVTAHMKKQSNFYKKFRLIWIDCIL